MTYVDNIDQEGLLVESKRRSQRYARWSSIFKHVSASHREAKNLPSRSTRFNRSDSEHLVNYNIRIMTKRYKVCRLSTITLHSTHMRRAACRNRNHKFD